MKQVGELAKELLKTITNEANNRKASTSSLQPTKRKAQTGEND